MAKEEFCNNLSQALKEVHGKLKINTYKLYLFKAESVADIEMDQMNADFIIKIVDTSDPLCITEVKIGTVLNK